MAFRDDRRGAAIQVGAVLLLGFLVIGLSLYQATVVPEQNERVEFRHNQAVQNDLLDLRNALLRAGTSESVQPVSVDMGTTYESRVFFVNPAPPGGLVRNGSARNVTVSNANATNDETADYLNTGANGPYNLTTKNVSYRPGYNVYRSAPTTTYQSGVTVNEFEDANDTAISGQTLVRGNRIYLVAVAGNLSRAQIGDLAIDPRSLSTATSATTVRNTTGGNVTLTVPTTLSADRWRTLLAPELDPSDSDPDRYVTDVSPGPRPNTISITLEANETYRLRTAYVGVGTGGSTPGPAYLTDVETRPGDDVTVETRDRYNNPVPNSQVERNLTVNVTDGRDLIEDPRQPVDENGRVGFEYNESASVLGTSDPLNLTLEYADGTPVAGVGVEEGSVNLTVTSEDLGNAGSPSQAGSSLVVLDDVSTPQNDEVTLRLRNIGNRSATFIGYRLGFATTLSAQGAFNDGPDEITQVTFNGTTVTGTATEYEAPYEFTPAEESSVDALSAGEAYDVTVTLDGDIVPTGNEKGALLSVSFFIEGVGTVEYTLTFPLS